MVPCRSIEEIVGLDTSYHGLMRGGKTRSTCTSGLQEAEGRKISPPASKPFARYHDFITLERRQYRGAVDGA
jgi:hypothetical protein